ncbi:MAG: diphthine--ammonia ligase [Thermoplasmata archaeon]|nr:diphthine--ammonia ligase [Thermoplasmata archaeon]
MTVTALVSGGKDSIFSAYLADTQGWTVDELLVLRPEDPDSWMFHTPNLALVTLQAEAWGKRCRSEPVVGRSEADEDHALRSALSNAHGPVIAGAIASSYQWSRLSRIADEIDRQVYTPLWGKEGSIVVRAEIDAGLDIRMIHLSAEPLTEELLGLRLDLALLTELERRSREQRRFHSAGEGGEFETLVVDAPFFDRRIALDETHVEGRGSARRLTVDRAHLEPKLPPGRPRTGGRTA